MSGRRAVWAAILVCCLVGTVRAADRGVTAELDPQDIYLGQSLLLRVLLPGRETAVITVPPLADWTVVPRGRIPGTETTGNGPDEAVTAYRFELIPRRSGELAVPALAVETGGRVLHTPALTARVRPRPTPPARLVGHDIFLDATLSHPDPYVGQAVVYTLRLYRAVTVSGISLTPPDFAGFFAVSLPGQRDGEIEAGGRRYAVTEADYMLTPLRPGKVTIPSGMVVCRGVPGKGIGGVSADVRVEGPVRRLEARPLPAFDGVGETAGLVGHMRLAASLSKKGEAPDQAVYTLTLFGRGNLWDAPAPRLASPAGVTVRALPAEGRGDWSRSGYAGQRVFRYEVRASRSGNFALPAVRLAVFDPDSAAYQVIVAAAENWTAPGPPPPAPGLAPPLRQRAAASPAAPRSWPWRIFWAVFPPFVYGLTFLPLPHRRRRGTALAPAALAEALRAVVDRSAGKNGREAAAALERLDRVLYAGEPVGPEERAAAITAARQALTRCSV